MIVDRINEYLASKGLPLDFAVREDGVAIQTEWRKIRREIETMAGWSFWRQFMERSEHDRKGTLRMSDSGKCPRQIAYAFHGIEPSGKEIDSRARIVFWMGDLVEMTVVQLARLAGVSLVGTGQDQISLEFQVNGAVIKGHPDGIVVGPPQRLLEVKSMASYAFRRFERGEIDEGYEAQINTYLSALDLDECVLVAVNKDAGVLGERVVKRNADIVDRARQNMSAVLKSKPDQLPPPAYTHDEKGFFPWQCLYCSYWKHCQNAEKVLVGKKYRLKLKEEKDGEKNGNA